MYATQCSLHIGLPIKFCSQLLPYRMVYLSVGPLVAQVSGHEWSARHQLRAPHIIAQFIFRVRHSFSLRPVARVCHCRSRQLFVSKICI